MTAKKKPPAAHPPEERDGTGGWDATADAVRAEKTFTLLGPDRRPCPSSAPGALGGHKGTRVYGRLDCPAALRAIAKGGYVKDRVFFADAATAIAAGYRPCGVCLPEKHRAWRTARTHPRVPRSKAA